MTENMASGDESLSDSDDDMICCHICLLRFNEIDRKPKFLDCHHYFCLNCIRGFSKGNFMSCPTCRNLTNMSGRQIEGLATNNIVLRLVNIATHRARELGEKGTNEQIQLTTPKNPGNSSSCKTKKLWCSVCSKSSTPSCQAQQHVLCDSREVLSKNMVMLENRVCECCEMWDKAILDRQRIHEFYDDMLNSLRIIQNDIMKRVESNDSNIALMESRKQVVRDLIVSIGSVQNLSEEDAINALEKTRNALDKLENWNQDGNRNKRVAQALLQNLLTIEENYVDASFRNVNPDNVSLQSTHLLRNLRLSFKGASHPDPSVKASVSLLTYVVLKATEEQPKNANENGNGNNSNQFDVSLQMAREADGLVRHPLLPVGKQTSGGGEKDYNGCHNAVSREGQLPNTVTSFRDSLLRPAVKPTNEWHVVSKSSSKEVKTTSKRISNVKTKCFFRITINGVLVERIVFQIEPTLAPVMSAKFIEMCTSDTGYTKSKIFKAIKNEAVIVSPRWNQDSEEEQPKVFVADRSEIKEQRGSMRFQVKQANAGIAEVSTDFQVILANRPRHHRCTTVFGQVVEGLSVFDKISEMNLRDNRIIIIECGMF